MNPAPASVISRNTLGPAQAIALFLARLLADLLRLRDMGVSRVSPLIAHKVIAADELVHVFICNLAARRLRAAGYTQMARAIRTTRAEYPLHLSPPDDMPTASPEELIARLETSITLLNKAEALSEQFTRLVFCALCMVFTGEETQVFHTISPRGPSREPRFTGAFLTSRDRLKNAAQAPHPWPPPENVRFFLPPAA